MPEKRTERAEEIYVKFHNHLVAKKLERARRYLIPIDKLIEQLLMQADLDYYKNRFEDKINEIPE